MIEWGGKSLMGRDALSQILSGLSLKSGLIGRSDAKREKADDERVKTFSSSIKNNTIQAGLSSRLKVRIL